MNEILTRAMVAPQLQPDAAECRAHLRAVPANGKIEPMKRVNWQLWSGFVLTIGAFLSYFLFLVRFPVTRDVPWLSFLLLVAGAALLVRGWLRAPRKILASIVAALGFAVFGFFTYAVTIGSKNLPSSARAPAVGQKAPDFALQDANGHATRLSDVLTRGNGVLLVFYRGHW